MPGTIHPPTLYHFWLNGWYYQSVELGNTRPGGKVSSLKTSFVANKCIHVYAFRVKHKTPVLGLAAQPESETIISYSDRKMYSWNVHKFLLEFSSLGCAVSGLAHTTHPASPRVVVATTEDAVVRLVSPVNGHIITTALLPVTSRIVSVATAAHTGMFVHAYTHEMSV